MQVEPRNVTRIVRVMMAIGSPPSIGIAKTRKTIMSLLAEANAEALVLLHERNFKIHKNVEELAVNNALLMQEAKDLKAEIQILQSKNNELLLMTSAVKSESHLIRELSDCEGRSL
jgi:hypothetical protein